MTRVTSIIGYHIADGTIVNSNGEVCKEPSYFDFLLKDSVGTIKLFYNMGYNLASLFKMIELTEDEGKRLQNTNKFYTMPYTLKYRAGKFFSIKKGLYYDAPFANFGDASQYKASSFKEDETIEDYLAKAKEAKVIGEQVYQSLVASGLHPTSLTSPVKAYEKEILSKVDLPTVNDMPEEAGYYAYQCLKGNWLEAFQLGHWEQAHDYDINSAFPSELARLLDTRHGKWEKTGSDWNAKGRYGYCKGIVNITAEFSPIVYSGGGVRFGGLNYTPVGSWETYLTKQEIEFIYKWKLGSFEITDGWWWVPEEDIVCNPRRHTVLTNLIEQLYQQKEKCNGIEREIVKREMSGIWGKFLQTKKDGFGSMFNPVYGVEVETNVRLRVADFVLRNRIMPIHIAVDGVLTAEPMMPDLSGSKLGRWELASMAPCICAGTATVAIKNREKTADFSLDYGWVMEEIKRNPEAEQYEMKKLSPVSLAVALNGNWEKLGQLHEVTKIIDARGDVKRCYRNKPKCGEDLLNKHWQSEAWDISIVQGV